MGNEESNIYLDNLNILIVGKPNVGKKTLIFNIFNHKFDENDCCLESSFIAKYTKKRTRITLFNTIKYPSNPFEQQEFDKFVDFYIKERSKCYDNNEKIHFLWYCIDSKSCQIDEYEKKFISQFSKIIPIIIVLTKSDDENTIYQTVTTIERSKLNINRIVPILSKNTILLDSYGLDNLIYFTINSLPSNIKFACKSYYDIINQVEDVNDEEENEEEELGSILNYQVPMNLKSRFNILVIGKTGIGKSALINAFFKGFDGTSARPFTRNIREISTPDIPFTIYDTPGLVMNESQTKELKKDILSLVKNGISTGDFNKFIHCIWYCVKSGSSRFEKDEVAFIKELTKDSYIIKIPLIILITQSYEKIFAKKYKECIHSFKLNQDKIIPLVAKDRSDQNNNTTKAYGLSELSEVTKHLIINKTRNNFIKRDPNLTIFNKELKKYIAPMLAKKDLK